jgi:hypothetical protein
VRGTAVDDILYIALVRAFTDNWHVVAIDTDRDKLMDALADVAQNFYPDRDIVRNGDQVLFTDSNAGDVVAGYIRHVRPGDYSFVDRLNRLAKSMQDTATD